MLHGGDIRSYAKESTRPWSSILDCSANINPLGPPQSVWRALSVAMPEILHYPDSRQTDVKRVIAERFSIPEEGVLCTNGATEAMELIVRHVRPTRCVILTPAFAEYEAIANRFGCSVVRVPLRATGHGYTLPWDELLQTLRPGDMLWLNNPHNPTSQGWSPDLWETQVQSLLARNVQVLLDESFLDFLAEHDEWTAISLAIEHHHVFVVRSATKIFAMPGLRFGFAVGNPAIVQQMEKARDNWSVNALAQAAASAAYKEEEFIANTRTWLARERSFILSTWGNHPLLRVHPLYAPYFLVRFADGIVAERVTDALREDGIYIRDCLTFAGLDSSYRRIALKLRVDNERVWNIVVSAI